METNSNSKKAAEGVKPVDKPDVQPQLGTKKTEPEVLILTFKFDFNDCESL